MGENLNLLLPSCTGSNDQENKGYERCWSDLPMEILELVLSNLFGADYTNFGGTCMSWQKATPFFPPPADSALSRLPYLMHLKDSRCKFFQPRNNVTYDHEDIQYLQGARVRRSSWGWLLMSRGYEIQFFFNPSTKEYIQLPNIPQYWGGSIADVYFSSPPTSSDCIVLAFQEFAVHTMEVYMIKRGEDKWTMKEFEKDPSFYLSRDGFVFNNGNLYFLGNAGDIAQLDLGAKSGEMKWEIQTKPLFNFPDYYDIRKMFTVKCDGGMLVVIITEEERKVQVRRCSLPEMAWEDVKNLGDEALYLSHGGSFLVKAPNESMSNKIYFPMFYDKNGVFYSLETQKYHSIAGDYSSETCFNFQLSQATSHWIQVSHEPTLSRDFFW